MLKTRAVVLHLVIAWLMIAPITVHAVESARFVEGRYKKGELKYINGLPVLLVQGTPNEIGEQEGALTQEVAGKMIDYPKDLLSVIGREDHLPALLEMSKSLLPQVPKDYLEELDAFARTSGHRREMLLGINTMVDTYRGGFGCSSLIVDGNRSATGDPLFGRNLDFFTLGRLQDYSLVVVCRPLGKHAFASVTFPGMIGCLSGMNEMGLAVAVHEVFSSRDGASMFDPKGIPYTFCFRRVLEECSTIEEAATLVRSMKRTTLLNLAVCDRNGGAVLEITPKTVELRRGDGGICACTNHFRSPALSTRTLARRYRILMGARRLGLVSLFDVAAKLHAVNLGRLTVQTMIFEPVPLRLHLAIGSCPSSALPLKQIELASLFDTGESGSPDSFAIGVPKAQEADGPLSATTP